MTKGKRKSILFLSVLCISSFSGILWYYSTIIQKYLDSLTIQEYRGNVFCLAFSPDSKFLATGGEMPVVPQSETSLSIKFISPFCPISFIRPIKENVQVWSLETGRSVYSFSEKWGNVFGGVKFILFTPDGERLAAISGYGGNIYNIGHERHKVFPIYCHKHFIDFASLSPDGRFLAVSSVGDCIPWETEIYSMETGNLVRPQIKDNYITKIIAGSRAQFTCNGKILISAADKNIFLFDTKDWKKICHLPMDFSYEDKKTLTASPDGKYLAFRGIVWSFEKNATHIAFPAYLSCFSHDSKYIATVDYDNSIHIYAVETGKLLKTLDGHKDGVYALCFSPDRKWLASSGADGRIKLHSLYEFDGR